MTRFGIGLALTIAMVATGHRADAQMFGQRTLGGFLSRRNPPGALNNPAEGMIDGGGALTGSERFIRGNRRVTDYIGTDTGDRRNFVGVTQARQPRTPPAAATVLEPKLPEVNRAPTESTSSNRPYPPRLVLAPDLSGPTPRAVVSAVEEHLLKSPIRWLSPLEVSLKGRTAVLRGEVGSVRDRELAEALARFEPGVSDIQNDLRVAPVGSTPSRPALPLEPSLESPNGLRN